MTQRVWTKASTAGAAAKSLLPLPLSCDLPIAVASWRHGIGTGVVKLVFGTGVVKLVFGTGVVKLVFGTGVVKLVFGTGVVKLVFGTGVVKLVFG
ncbi:hypothetical protein, partial [Nocardia xishanensis]